MAKVNLRYHTIITATIIKFQSKILGVDHGSLTNQSGLFRSQFKTIKPTYKLQHMQANLCKASKKLIFFSSNINFFSFIKYLLNKVILQGYKNKFIQNLIFILLFFFLTKQKSFLSLNFSTLQSSIIMQNSLIHTSLFSISFPFSISPIFHPQTQRSVIVFIP